MIKTQLIQVFQLPDFKLDLEREAKIHLTLGISLELAKAHVLYCLYRTRIGKYLRSDFDSPSAVEHLNRVTEFVDRAILELTKSNTIKRERLDTETVKIMLTAYFVGFNAQPIKVITGLDRYLIEKILVLMMKNEFWMTDGRINAVWFDETVKYGDIPFILDVGAVTGRFQREFRDGEAFYRKIDGVNL